MTQRHEATRSAEDLAQRCLELVRIPSVTGEERALADHIERWARGLRAAPPVERLGNCLVVGRPDGRRPCVGLVGHLDTVPPSADDGVPRGEGDRVYGRGASDMKGALAVMQALAEDLDFDALPVAPVLVFYDREEGPYTRNGLQPLLDTYAFLRHINLALCLEPTDNALQLGCLGTLHARLTFEGKAAHSARPWQGDNAIHKAGPLLVELGQRGVRDVAVAGFTFREVMSATVAQGGKARNVIPDQFEVSINYRYAPSASADARTRMQQAQQEVLEFVAGRARVEFPDVAPAGSIPQGNALLDHLRRLGNLRAEPKQAWTDVARLALHDIDAVNFGPGYGAQAHQAGEYASASMMLASYTLLRRFLATPPP